MRITKEMREREDKEIARREADGTLLDGLVPVKVKAPTGGPRGVFSVRLSAVEVQRISDAAAELNLTMSDFMRLAALAGAEGTEQTKKLVAWEKARQLVNEAADVLAQA